MQYDACRDLSGLVVLLSCVDLCFLVRDNLSNRKLASMINWTEVVSANIFKFIFVHIFLLLGFAFGLYIQLHHDVLKAEDGEDDGDTFNELWNIPFKVIESSPSMISYA